MKYTFFTWSCSILQHFARSVFAKLIRLEDLLAHHCVMRKLFAQRFAQTCLTVPYVLSVGEEFARPEKAGLGFQSSAEPLLLRSPRDATEYKNPSSMKKLQNPLFRVGHRKYRKNTKKNTKTARKAKTALFWPFL